MLMCPPINRVNAWTCGNPIPVPFSPFVVKRGSKTLPQDFGRHPATVILDADADITFLDQVGRVSAFLNKSFCDDLYVAAFRHGIPGVDYQIEHRCIEQCGIDQASRGIGRHVDFEPDHLARAISQ